MIDISISIDNKTFQILAELMRLQDSSADYIIEDALDEYYEAIKEEQKTEKAAMDQDRDQHDPDTT